MNTDPQQIIDQALQLGPAARALIAEAMLESLDFEEDFPISAEWMEEIRRRCAGLDDGTAPLVDHADAMHDLRRKYA